MDPLTLGLSAGNSLINLFGQYMTNRTNMKINQMNNQFNEAESYKAYQRQRSLIAEQNEYNSYENQRSLMEAAGYNPNSLVGGTAGTAVSTGSTSSTPATASSPLGAQFQKIDLASSYAQLANLQSQRDLNDANSRKADAEADRAAADAANIRSNTPTNGNNLGDANFENIVANTQNLKNNAKLFDATFDNQVLNSELVNTKLDRESEYLKSQYLSLYQKMDLDKAEFEYNMNHRWPAEVRQIQAATKLSLAQCSAAYAQAQMYVAQKRLADAQAAGQEITNEYLRNLYSDPSYIQAVKDQAIAIARKTAADANASEKGWPWISNESSSSSFSGGGISTSSSYSGPVLPGDVRATDSIPNVQSKPSSPTAPPPVNSNDAGFASREYEQYLYSLTPAQLRKLVPDNKESYDAIMNFLDTDYKWLNVPSYSQQRKSVKKAIENNYKNRKSVHKPSINIQQPKTNR